jgi:hypothetical protein
LSSALYPTLAQFPLFSAQSLRSRFQYAWIGNVLLMWVQSYAVNAWNPGSMTIGKPASDAASMAGSGVTTSWSGGVRTPIAASRGGRVGVVAATALPPSR